MDGQSSQSYDARPRAKLTSNDALVAQLDRVLPSEGRGRGFESRRARHYNPASQYGSGPNFIARKSTKAGTLGERSCRSVRLRVIHSAV